MDAFTGQGKRYVARNPPSGMPEASWLYEELKRIEIALDLLLEGRLIEEYRLEPSNPETGMVVLVAGSDWDPGGGRGIYYYDSEQTPNWIKIA